jgi:hypothetical protein
MIFIGEEGNYDQQNALKDASAEINIGMTLGVKGHLEMFHYEKYCCFILEYCEGGDLQGQLDSGKHYDELV